MNLGIYKNKIRNIFKNIDNLNLKLDRTRILHGRILSELNLKKNIINGLNEVEFSVFSQWGEDGIISWLVDCLPEIPHTFVEFGVEDYQESNTRFLLLSRNWQGVIIDGSAENILNIKDQEIYWRHQLNASNYFIDRDNINPILMSELGSKELGILSIDIDGNDYWVWEAVNVVNPVLVICEYNSVFGDQEMLTVPYRSDFVRSKANHTNLYFGASLRLLMRLGRDKGYSFIGTTSSGCNAFFVRNDFSDKIYSKLSNVWAYPAMYRESRDKKGNLTYVSGIDSSKLIANCYLQDIENNIIVQLNEISNLYSSEWLQSTRILIDR